MGEVIDRVDSGVDGSCCSCGASVADSNSTGAKVAECKSAAPISTASEKTSQIVRRRYDRKPSQSFLSADEVDAWQMLVDRAEMSLSEDVLSAADKRRDKARARLKKLGYMDWEFPIDLGRVEKFVVRWAESVIGVGVDEDDDDGVVDELVDGEDDARDRRNGKSKCKSNDKGNSRESVKQWKFKDELAACKLTMDDFYTARDLCRDVYIVSAYIKERKREFERDSDDDMVDKARMGLRRLVSEDDCGLNAKSVEFALKSLRADTYGDAGKMRGDDSRRDGGVGTVYKISGVTINLALPEQGARTGGVCMDASAIVADSPSSAGALPIDV